MIIDIKNNTFILISIGEIPGALVRWKIDAIGNDTNLISIISPAINEKYAALNLCCSASNGNAYRGHAKQ